MALFTKTVLINIVLCVVHFQNAMLRPRAKARPLGAPASTAEAVSSATGSSSAYGEGGAGSHDAGGADNASKPQSVKRKLPNEGGYVAKVRALDFAWDGSNKVSMVIQDSAIARNEASVLSHLGFTAHEQCNALSKVSPTPDTFLVQCNSQPPTLDMPLHDQANAWADLSREFAAKAQACMRLDLSVKIILEDQYHSTGYDGPVLTSSASRRIPEFRKEQRWGVTRNFAETNCLLGHGANISGDPEAEDVPFYEEW